MAQKGWAVMLTPEQLIAEARRQAALNHVDVAAMEDYPEITWTELNDMAQLFGQLADALASAQQLADIYGAAVAEWRPIVERVEEAERALASAQQQLERYAKTDPASIITEAENNDGRKVSDVAQARGQHAGPRLGGHSSGTVYRHGDRRHAGDGLPHRARRVDSAGDTQEIAQQQPAQPARTGCDDCLDERRKLQQRIAEFDEEARGLNAAWLEQAKVTQQRIQQLEQERDTSAQAVTQMSREVRSLTKRYEERIATLEQERDRAKLEEPST